jgi:glucose-1-phosphate adenylyltransferase
MKQPLRASTTLDPGLIRQADDRPKMMIGVGSGGRPFLDYLLYNARGAGILDVVIVIGAGDHIVRHYYGLGDRYNSFHGLRISYAIQTIPPNRSKPLGTADALHQALLSRPDWRGGDFIVCNSDNLYSQGAMGSLVDFQGSGAWIDYDANGLDFDQRRIAQFGLTRKDPEGYLLEIVEKPAIDELEILRDRDGTLRVSMNIFRLNYDMVITFLKDCPEHPMRQEKELTTAINNMVRAFPRALKAIPRKEHVPDLTHKEDIARVQAYLKKRHETLNW